MSEDKTLDEAVDEVMRMVFSNVDRCTEEEIQDISALARRIKADDVEMSTADVVKMELLNMWFKDTQTI